MIGTKKVFIYSFFVFLILDSAELNSLCVLIFLCILLLSSIKQPYLNRSVSIKDLLCQLCPPWRHKVAFMLC